MTLANFIIRTGVPLYRNDSLGFIESTAIDSGETSFRIFERDVPPGYWHVLWALSDFDVRSVLSGPSIVIAKKGA